MGFIKAGPKCPGEVVRPHLLLSLLLSATASFFNDMTSKGPGGQGWQRSSLAPEQSRKALALCARCILGKGQQKTDPFLGVTTVSYCIPGSFCNRSRPSHGPRSHRPKTSRAKPSGAVLSAGAGDGWLLQGAAASVHPGLHPSHLCPHLLSVCPLCPHSLLASLNPVWPHSNRSCHDPAY